ncbi:MAG: DNA repair protein RecO [Flavobacteriales bacterium CG_4_9_14_3_um_filter_32_8]|nr:MAG: DNA repair protein RecO [Flavobacteriales bacterium CG_4_9_14_3_um_filter_32_8]
MLYTTKGIVIHHFKYAEKSVIAKIYTEKFGLLSFILNGVRNAKSKNKAVYLQSLSLVEINFFYKEKKGLQQVKDIRLTIPYATIPFNINKSTIAFFIAEILYKSIKEEESNVKLFDFLYHAFQFLDLQDTNYSNFHLVFLAQFCKKLGFFPQTSNLSSNANLHFALQDGCFVNHQPLHQPHISPPISFLFLTILQTSFDTSINLKIDALQRKLLLTNFLDYYNLHLSNFDNLKTVTILEEILN